jgi:branched-chain amino acid transport system ATP-binding protein
MNRILYTSDLTKTFGSFLALKHVNLKVDSERIHSIIGPNGAGKTTLFNLITGTLRKTSGEIFFEGKEITHTPHFQRTRMGIARSFQITNIFSEFTVFENVRLAIQSAAIGGYKFFSNIDSYSDIKAKTLQILDYTNLGHLKDKEAGILAHGDQRNLEIAISLATKPKLILLDEPTAGMSLKEINYTTKLIKKVSESIQVLLVEHRMDIIMSISDIITVLSQGEVIAVGTPSEIRSNPEVKKAYLGE